MFEIVLVNVYFEVSLRLIQIILINKILNIYCNDKNSIDK